MRIGKIVFRSVALFSLATTSAFATNHNVAVGQNNQGMAALAFNPSSLTITAGDTVTFTNAGGFHNAHSTGGPTAFQCSVDCVSNNTPDGSAWSDVVTFPTAGTVTYQCDLHGPGSGMTGTINVQPLPVRLQSFDVK